MSELPSILELIEGRGLPSIVLAAGEKLFLRGDAPGRMFIVRSGEIEVLLDGHALERVGPGGIVGEMALFDGIDRSAAALSASAVELLAVDRAAFLELVAAEPRFALAVLGVLAARLRRANAARTR